ncbi:MAG TPA: DUF4870 domain-containing protein [Micromonosporaceae bacterium]|jgi:hypothetical protein
MTDPGYPTPADPGNPQAPGVPGQFPPPQPTYGAPQPTYGNPQQPAYGAQQPTYGTPQPAAPGTPPPAPNYGAPQQNYGAPQQNYAQQQPGQFAPAGPVAPPAGYASAEDKQWALVSHFGGAVGNLFCGVLGFVAPLIALTSKGKQSPTVRQHALAALNFQAPISAVAIVLIVIRIFVDIAFDWGFAFSALLDLVSFVVFAVGVVFGILAGVKANEGTLYKYPLNLNLFK